MQPNSTVSAWPNSGFEASISNSKISRYGNGRRSPSRRGSTSCRRPGTAGSFAANTSRKAATTSFLRLLPVPEWKTFTVDRAKNGLKTERLAVRFTPAKDSEIDLDDDVVSPIE